MIYNAYALLDVKTGLYSMPWFFPHDATAFRTVNEVASSKENTVGRYPTDYVLYKVGLFDDNTGHVSPLSPVNMGTAASILASMSDTPNL